MSNVDEQYAAAIVSKSKGNIYSAVIWRRTLKYLYLNKYILQNTRFIISRKLFF